MEIYLSHMVIFRVIEKLGLNRWFGEGWIQYIVTVVTVFGSATVFAVVTRKIIKNSNRAVGKIFVRNKLCQTELQKRN